MPVLKWQLNGIADRTHIEEFCDEKLLTSIPLGTRALIISDCEGYEAALFSQTLAQRLSPHDLIVETHDFIDIEISSKVRSAFGKTHNVESIKTLDDIGRAHTYQCRELEKYTTKERRIILSERRPAIMEWLVMTPRAAEPDKCKSLEKFLLAG